MLALLADRDPATSAVLLQTDARIAALAHHPAATIVSHGSHASMPIPSARR